MSTSLNSTYFVKLSVWEDVFFAGHLENGYARLKKLSHREKQF
jgi:hypothetical protein